jgi:hypothetical protein
MTTLTAPRTVEHVEASGLPSAGRVQCGRCGKVFCDTAVVSGTHQWDGEARQHTFEPDSYEWSHEHGCYVMLRRLYCDHCDHIMSWLEQVAPLSDPSRGTLTGHVVSGPGYTRSRRTIDQFLRQFPQAAGVQQR